MKKFLLPILCLVLSCTWAKAENEPVYYNTCENAIYVDSAFTMAIQPDTYYYFTANTFDLPLTVYFFPNEETTVEPEVYVDFTCETGVYTDPNIRNLVSNAEGYDIHFPMMPELGKYTNEEGVKGFKLSYDRDLLDIMAAFNVDYSVPVYVSLISETSGTAQINNKKTTTDCEELSILWEKEDTIHLLANDSATVYRIPVSEWYTEGNGISLKWSGSTPINAIVLRNPHCLLADTIEALNVWDKWSFSIAERAGGYAEDITPTNMTNLYQKNPKQIYVQFFPQENGTVHIEDYKERTVTVDDCIDDWFGQSVAIPFPTTANGFQMNLSGSITSYTESYYLVAKTLKDKNIHLSWQSSAHQPAGAFFAKHCGFELNITDADVIDTLTFCYDAADQLMHAYMPAARVNQMLAKADSLLFLQIGRVETGTFRWDEYTPLVLDCDQKTIVLAPDTTLEIPPYNDKVVYKIQASRWLDGYEHTVKWESTKQTQFYISDTCDYTWSSTNPHILPNVPKTISKNTTKSFPAATLQEMFTGYADDFGNLYVRMRSGAEGKLRVKTIIPEIPTGTLSATHGDRTTRLILRNNSIFIEVTDGTTTTLYDLTGRQVQ